MNIAMGWWSVYIVLFLHSVQGQNLELSGSGNFSIKGDEYTFICTLQVPGDTISFKRGTDNICTVNTQSCSSNQSPGYRCRCYTNSQTIQLTITSIRLDDEANWLCQAFGDASDVSNSVALPVYYTPKITSSKEIQHSNSSECFDVVLRCDVDSKPVSSVKWSNDKNNDLHSGTTYTLNDVPCDSEYNYTCTASNSIGNPVIEEFNIFEECSNTSASSQSTSTPTNTTAEQSSDTTTNSFNTTTESFDSTTESLNSTTGLSSETTENARTELNSTQDLGLIVGVSVGALVVLGIVILVVYCWRRNGNKPNPDLRQVPESNNSPATEGNQPDLDLSIALAPMSDRDLNDSPTLAESEPYYEIPVSPSLQDSAVPIIENSTINPQPSTYNRNCSVNTTDNNSTEINPIGDQSPPQDGYICMRSTNSPTRQADLRLGEKDTHYENMDDPTES